MSEHTRNRRDTTPLNGPEPEDEAKLRELAGDRPAADQGTGVFSAENVGELGEITDSDQYLGEIEAGVHDDLPGDPESLELLTELELRAEETDDAFTASDEGMTYVPPIDPPTVPSDDLEDAEIASGFGVSAMDEGYDPDSQAGFLPPDDQMEALVREALRADSATSQYADLVNIAVSDGVVTLRGEVVDLEDSDNLLAVAAYVEGVVEVVDRLRVRALERGAE
ncbi:MAG TPA: BON domain-containing protein [Chloroflexaceae bacterium]|nr:BON domain-containing protein [Chloroflexaceae bacterium]